MQVEAAWSEALDATRGSHIEQLTEQLGALASVLLHEINLEETRRGEPIRLPGLPLHPAVAGSLVINPDDNTRDRQQALAITLAFEDLARALGALRAPTQGVIDLVDGTVRSWWSQEGFTRLNRLTGQVVRVARSNDTSEADHLRAMAAAALDASAHGMPEAAVLYLLGAFDHETERAGPLARAFGPLHAAGAALANGERVALDALVPIARFWTEELRRRLAAASTTINVQITPDQGTQDSDA